MSLLLLLLFPALSERPELLALEHGPLPGLHDVAPLLLRGPVLVQDHLLCKKEIGSDRIGSEEEGKKESSFVSQSQTYRTKEERMKREEIDGWK